MDKERKLTIGQALREAIQEEMARDESIFLMGENIGIEGGWGGAGSVCLGLAQKFGPERVKDTPISESGYTGAAIGAAISGMRPVIETAYGDFIFCAMDQIINQAAKMRYMSGGQVRVPLVFRIPTGSSGRGTQHAQSLEAYFMCIPGWKVVVGTADPYSAKGLLKTAIRDNSPVAFFEHKLLYGTRGFKKEKRGLEITDHVPEEEYLLPFGKADVKREGEDVTLISWLLMLHRSLAAAKKLEEKGISVEVISPQTLVPFDTKTVIDSVKKTRRLVIVEEGPKRGSVGAGIAATIYEDVFDYLDAPIKHVAALDVPVPFAPIMENYVIPDEDNITRAIEEIV